MPGVVNATNVELFLPTPSTRRATNAAQMALQQLSISTHALHEEGDGFAFLRLRQAGRISTHALHEEGDQWTMAQGMNAFSFLPTPSTRRAT